MCGITAFVQNKENRTSDEDISKNRDRYVELSKRIRHRGPDWSGIYINDNVMISHERLSIVGVDCGSQPLKYNDDNNDIVLSVNGEIYNYKNLYSTVLHNKYTPQTNSDCEVIMYLYIEFGPSFVKMLDGIFSFVLYDKHNEHIYIARDPIGIIPLYYGITAKKDVWISSELKVIHDQCVSVDVFPPASYFINSNNTTLGTNLEDTQSSFTNYYDNNWKMSKNKDEETIAKELNRLLTLSVKKRLMTDVPFGVLLSGGLDSSLIASITNKLLKGDSDTKTNSWGTNLHSFSIGLKGSPDLKYARIVADYLGTIHHEYLFTVQEGIDAITELIYHLETYDVTTIRASTPMYLMSRKIKSMGIKMVLSGEGADEVFGGYLYFHSAPNAQEFHDECLNRVSNLHHFDCLRANKSTMSWGLEARVPFLDKSFLEYAMPIHGDVKLNREKKIEKYIVRKAFTSEIAGEEYLPDEILWRQKEQFSDGVGYNWIDDLKAFIETQITDEELSLVNEKYSVDVPKTKEAMYFRQIFDRLFPNRENIVPRWIPRTDWDGVSYDPSGRAQKIHTNTTRD